MDGYGEYQLGTLMGEIHALHPEENNKLVQPVFANSREKKRAQIWNSDLY